MLDYTDSRWNDLKGGYRVPYNPVPTLQRLEHDDKPQQCWDELWQELYHQGDVGDASYATLVKLVDLKSHYPQLGQDLYNFVIAVELARQEPHNPELPTWLEVDYHKAIERIYQIALAEIRQATDENLIYSILGILALYKKQYALAKALLEEEESTLKEYFESR